MDVLSTPRRPHKSPAHTVKDRILAQRFRFRVPNISSERAAYYTTIFETVNTFFENLFRKVLPVFDPSISPAAAPIEGGRIIHPISVSSTPAKQLFCFDLSTSRRIALCRAAPFRIARRRGANPTSNSRFVNPQCATLFSEPRRARRCLSGDQAHTGERTLVDLQQMLSTDG